MKDYPRTESAVGHMDAVYKRRSYNLRKQITGRFEAPCLTNASKALALPLQNLSKYAYNRLRIVEGLAREIEAKLGLEFGSLDNGVATELHHACARVLETSNA
tara:strand:- start:4090 stop:4398 length:309 start_codon:yes stop_codon:yes gene_type:complete